VVFSKSWCSYSRNSKRILDGLNAKYAHLELDQAEDGDEIQDALATLTGQHTVPNIFIGKKHIGGNSELQRYSKKDLEKLLKEVGAIAT
jgi:glutaredoxin 3